MKTRKPLLLAALAATALVGLLGAAPAQALTFPTKTIQLPESTRVFPGSGPGAAAANSYCLMCHSAGMVMNQPDLTRDAWTVEVNKMRNAFKAPIPEDQVNTLVDYLMSIKGKQ